MFKKALRQLTKIAPSLPRNKYIILKLKIAPPAGGLAVFCYYKTMDIENFEELVREGIKAIPQKFLDLLDNVDIIVEENPTPEQLKKLKIKNNYFLFGLYEGIPKTERWGYGQALPDKITIFKNPIEQTAQTKEEIKQLIKDTVWHEIAHHFGMNEDRVRKAETRRKRPIG